MEIWKTVCIFAAGNHVNIKNMARPIKETPILTGEDAERFVERAERVEQMSKEERAENRRQLEEICKRARKYINFCW